MANWWTHTANWQSGCRYASPACANCYARRMSKRLAAMGRPLYENAVDAEGQWTGALRYSPKKLRRTFLELYRARKPRAVFCGSMTDLWHENAPSDALEDLAGAIQRSHWRDRQPHTLMFLTKRATRLLEWQREHFPSGLPGGVWVGVTAEDQRRADERIPLLLEVRAPVRFLSCEPLLGRLDLTRIASWARRGRTVDVLRGGTWDDEAVWGFVTHSDMLDLYGTIGWVIAGPESGPGARIIDPQWALDLLQQCTTAGTPCWWKGGEVEGQRWEQTPPRAAA